MHSYYLTGTGFSGLSADLDLVTSIAAAPDKFFETLNCNLVPVVRKEKYVAVETMGLCTQKCSDVKMCTGSTSSRNCSYG